MLFERSSGLPFTEHMQKVLRTAQDEALRLNHEYVGTEHMLLALVRDADGVGATVLLSLNAHLGHIQWEVEKMVKRGKVAPSKRSDLPYTSRAKAALTLAACEARELSHAYVGTEHLLLGLLREERGVAAQVLVASGVTLDVARGETLRVLAPGGRSRDSSATDRSRPTFRVRVDDSSDRSIYEQIVGQVQEAVATGVLAAGDRLPTVRQQADALDIAPGTVARAYAELERLGVVVTEGARGTRVAPRRPPGIPQADRPETLIGLLRPVVVAAFHLGASAEELRDALQKAMKDIFGNGKRDAA